MLAQHTQAFHQTRIAGGYRSSVSVSPQVFCRIEAKAGETAGGTDGSVIDRGAVCLRAIFDDNEVVLCGQLFKRPQVHGPAVKMDGDDRSGTLRDCVLGERGIHVKGEWID